MTNFLASFLAPLVVAVAVSIPGAAAGGDGGRVLIAQANAQDVPSDAVPGVAGSADQAPAPQVAPPTAAPSAPPNVGTAQAGPSGQWVYTTQYGWLWMPYGDSYTYAPQSGDPYMYVYYPTYGWSWVVAPWIWGWGPVPYFSYAYYGGWYPWYARWGWYGHGHGYGGWYGGGHWYGHGPYPTPYHGGPYRAGPVGVGGSVGFHGSTGVRSFGGFGGGGHSVGHVGGGGRHR